MKRRDFLKTALATSALASTGRGADTPDTPATGMIDSFCHFSSMRMIDALEAAGGPKPHVFRSLFAHTPTLIDAERRLEIG